MIKYAFLLEEKFKKPLADKPKRNAKVFHKSMGKIISTILESQKTVKVGDLLNVMLNKDLKLCSARFEKGDFIYNIIVKEFPGPSNRFFMKILKEIYQARKQSGMLRKNFNKKQRAFEIELKKVIKKFNESEIQYKYFMKKIQIEEQQKKTQLLEQRRRAQLADQHDQAGRDNLALPRKTRIISEIEAAQAKPEEPMHMPRKTRIISEIDQIPKPESEVREEVVTIQTGNQTGDDHLEIPTTAESPEEPLEGPKGDGGLIVTHIDHLDKQTLGVDSGSHYIVRKTRMLEQQTLSKLAKMEILPEANSESETSEIEESKVELKGGVGVPGEYHIKPCRVESSDESDQNQLTEPDRPDRPRHTKQFIEGLPELNQSTVVTIDLQDSEFMNKELFEFEDFEDENEDGVDDRRSNLEKKWNGFLWWNSDKSFSQNLTLNMRKNPYFRALLLSILVLTLVILLVLAISVAMSKHTEVSGHEEESKTISII